MEKRKVFFKNSRGQKLCGILEGPERAKAGVLLIPGYASGKDEWFSFFADYSSVLNKAGFLTLRFDRSGIGESEGDFAESTPETELGDCMAAYKYFKKMCDSVGIAGHSMGGVLAVMLASRVRAKALVSSAPPAAAAILWKELFTDKQMKEMKTEGKTKIPSDWEEKFGIRFLGMKYFSALEGFDIAVYAGNVKVPTLILYGTKDETVDMNVHAKPLYDALKCEKSLVAIEGDGHDFKSHRDKFFSIAAAWFKKYL